MTPPLLLVILAFLGVPGAYLTARDLYARKKLERIGPDCPPLTVPARASNPGKPVTLVVGDSRVADLPVPSAGGEGVIRTLGFPGGTTWQLRKAFPRILASGEWSRILIIAGINDCVAASLTDPESRDRLLREASENLAACVELGDRSGTIVHVLEVAPPSDRWSIKRLLAPASLPVMVANLNRALAGDQRIKLVPSPFALLPTGRIPRALTVDDVHFSAGGKEKLMRAILQWAAEPVAGPGPAHGHSEAPGERDRGRTTDFIPGGRTASPRQTAAAAPQGGATTTAAPASPNV